MTGDTRVPAPPRPEAAGVASSGDTVHRTATLGGGQTPAFPLICQPYTPSPRGGCIPAEAPSPHVTHGSPNTLMAGLPNVKKFHFNQKAPSPTLAQLTSVIPGGRSALSPVLPDRHLCGATRSPRCAQDEPGSSREGFPPGGTPATPPCHPEALLSASVPGDPPWDGSPGTKPRPRAQVRDAVTDTRPRGHLWTNIQSSSCGRAVTGGDQASAARSHRGLSHGTHARAPESKICFQI